VLSLRQLFLLVAKLHVVPCVVKLSVRNKNNLEIDQISEEFTKTFKNYRPKLEISDSKLQEKSSVGAK